MWKLISKKSFTNLSLLFDFLELSEKQKSLFLNKSSFPLLLPFRLANKIKKRSVTDPLLLQFVPTKFEQVKKRGFCLDPLQEQIFCKRNLIKKYPKRALLLSPSCCMHCRFCFRRHLPTPFPSFQEELEEIRKDSSLQEVILSGGDPLSLSNDPLQHLLLSLEKIPHIRRLRIHTRFPIGIPERIDASFLSILGELKKPLFFVLHANHPKEFDEDLFFFLRKIQGLNIPLLAQTVLLKGINDNVQTLIELYETLIDEKIFPYYLHKLDPIHGSSHFHLSQQTERKLVEALKQQLPGYGMPKFVQEIAGKKSKTILG
jgi:EF-P beta-lysylation protein EpmB